jgi:adenine-specific DNA-methyltransferase
MLGYLYSEEGEKSIFFLVLEFRNLQKKMLYQLLILKIFTNYLSYNQIYFGGDWMANREPIIKYQQGNAFDIPEKKFDLIITSPPYNLGKEYERKVAFNLYLDEQAKIISKLVPLLSDRGSICWQVGNSIDKKNKEIIPLDIFFYKLFKENNLYLRNRIIWHFGHGYHSRSRFSGRYETILWFTKTNNYIFNLDDVRVPSKYPGKRFFKGPNKGKLSGNPKGKNPSDVWEIVINDWDNEIWNIPNVKANHIEKTEHPCQYPVELVERCILALTEPDSWILDPFAGVGSTLLAAFKNNRNAVGIELVQKYIDIGLMRLDFLKEGRLSLRPLSKPVMDPKESPLSIMPDEFKVEANENT